MLSFYERLLAFAYQLQPSIAMALIRAFRELSVGFKETAVADAIARGDLSAAADMIASASTAAIAMVPVKEEIRDALIKSAIHIFRDTPKGPPEPGRLPSAVRFNTLDPNIARAAEAFESPLLDTLTTEIRDGVLSAIRAQVAEGVGPRAAARAIRPLVGLSSNQVQYLSNYRAELAALDRGALARQLTDGRYDRIVARAIAKGTPLSAEQIDRFAEAYGKNLKAQTAETLTRTASINAMKEGQRLAWQQAIDGGKVSADDLIDTWHTQMDGRERPSHAEMNGQTKRFDDQWIVPGVGPQDYPGQGEYNCRCVCFTRVRIRRASERTQSALSIV